ncbi:MAG: polysaccharide biosynthesis/export family protein [Hyphomicrobium sp.]|nr:polysaccharide biosynthesis/export family protein [Hyphomicrobium sp.]
MSRTTPMLPAGPRLLAVTAVMLSLCLYGVASPSAAAEDSAYRLAPGDRITVVVLGQADLSGDYPVDGNGSIMLPIVGALELGKLTIAEAQARIVSALADGILNDPSVFVKIGEMRPIQILGDVRTAGSFPFRYGTMVKSAVGLAGGYGAAGVTPSQALTDYLAADERLRLLEDQQWRLSVRKARLLAQIAGVDVFEPPPTPAVVTNAEAQSTLADERSQLNARQTETARRIALIEAQKGPLEAEIAAIGSQIDAEKRQLQLISEHRREYQKLQKSGLARFETLIQIQLNAAAKEGIIWRLEGDRSRLASGIGEIAIRIDDARTADTRASSADLEAVKQRLREIEMALPAAREVRALKLREAGSTGNVTVKRQFLVTRIVDARAATIEVSDDAILQPGDVLDVRTLTALERPPLASWEGGGLDNRPTSIAENTIE